MLNGRLLAHNHNGQICDQPACSLEHVDLEKLCAAVLQRKGGNELPFHEREDALAWLVEACWAYSLEYDPARNANTRPGRNGGFAGSASHHLSRRYTDRIRSVYRTRWQFSDRTYERERPIVLSIDAYSDPAARYDAARDRPFERRLGDFIGTGSGDPQNDRSPDLMRILRKGNRRTTRPSNQMGGRPTRRAA